MEFEITQETLLWAYGSLHVLYGLVTHYHSVAQIRAYNRISRSPVPVVAVVTEFVLVMAIGFPAFIIKSIVAPTGNKWHATPEEIIKAW